MAAIIKIKRSNGTSAPSSLNAGELAFTYDGSGDNTNQGTSGNNGERLFIGDGSNVHVIGGKYFTDMLNHTAGTLTASSAIIVDSSSKIDNLKVDNLDLDGNTLSATNSNGDVTITANGSGAVDVSKLKINGSNVGGNGFTLPTVDGTSGQILTTDGSGTVSFSSPASSSFTLTDGTNSDTFNTGETITFTGSGAIGTAVADTSGSTGSTITISAQDASTSDKGVASFASANFTVSSGAVSIANGGVDTTQLAADAVDGTKIADDSIDSEHIVDGSIDSAHLAADIVDGTKIADDSIDSEHIVDGSVDRVHLAADIVDGTKIADDSIDSEHIVDGSVDNVHLANSSITIGSDSVSLGGTLSSLTSLSVDNISIDGNSITTTNSNGDLTLNPNGSGTVIVSGDLTVTGSTTTVESTTVTIDDPILSLADNNDNSTSGDAVDIGFYGTYYDSTASAAKHTGFFRDADNGEYYIVTGIAKGESTTPGTTFSFTESTDLATLNAIIDGGTF